MLAWKGNMGKSPKWFHGYLLAGDSPTYSGLIMCWQIVLHEKIDMEKLGKFLQCGKGRLKTGKSQKEGNKDLIKMWWLRGI